MTVPEAVMWCLDSGVFRSYNGKCHLDECMTLSFM